MLFGVKIRVSMKHADKMFVHHFNVVLVMYLPKLKLNSDGQITKLNYS